VHGLFLSDLLLNLVNYGGGVNSNEVDQFSVDIGYFHQQMDFINWIRFFFLLKQIIADRPDRVLEVGVGGGFLRDSAERFVGSYEVLDINDRLDPDHLGDVREEIPGLSGSFDKIVAADVLEHVPFEDLGRVLSNMHMYLKKSGKLLVTIPHRRSNFMYMTPRNIPTFLSVPTGFLSPGAFYRRFIKRKIWIDPDQAWEIGDGNVKVRDVERKMVDSGFSILSRKKLFYVDFWVLQRA
jgi:SAM-dependent methyltransferase